MHAVLLGAEQEAIEELARLGHDLTVLYVDHDRTVMRICADLIKHRAHLPSFDRPEAAWGALIHLGVVDEVDVIIPGHEFAVTTAALLNRTLGLRVPMEPEVALAGRDKALQKSLWRRHGVPTARFTVFPERPESAEELAHGLGDLTPPYVVKPVADGGTHLVFACDSAGQLMERLRENPELEHFMVEERQSGDEWHFDGTIADGRIEHFMVSRYLAPLIETKSGSTLRSVGLPVRDYPELYAEAREFAESARAALGGRWGVFHFEVFGAPGRFVAGELAWRPPGVLASLCARQSVGVSLWAAHALLYAGEPVTAEPPSPSVHGFVCLPVRPGFRNGVTQQDIEALPGVRHVRMKVLPGQPMRGMNTSTTAVAWALIEGEDLDRTTRLIDDSVRLVEELHLRKSVD
ncbi:ATP-grasp domain-containing protein [Kitasatospora sp. NPDC004240]